MHEVIVTDYENLKSWNARLFKNLSNKNKIFIKPNLCNGSPPSSGVTTDLKIVISLIQSLKEIGVTDICVGESAIYNTDEVLKKHGFYSLKDYGVKAINLDTDEWIKVKSKLFESFKNFHLPKTVLESDIIISVPKMKTHALTGVTLSIKNLFGLIPRGDRKIAHKENINEAIVAIFNYLNSQKKFFSIVDGITALEGKRGPTIGNPVNLGLIIMGNDPVAVDATCVRIMGANPIEIPHINIAKELGLGHTEDIEIICKHTFEVKRFVFPDINSKHYGNLIYVCADKIFKKYPYIIAQEKCTFCKGCINICPKGCVSHNSKRIIFDYIKCINCLCCCEVCKDGALDYRVKYEKLYKLLRQMRNITRNKINGI